MALRWAKLHPVDLQATPLSDDGPEGNRLVGEIARYDTCRSSDHAGIVLQGFLSGAGKLGALGCWTEAVGAQVAVERAHRSR